MAAQSSIDDKTLRLLSEKLGTGWESLATFLNISAVRVSNIKMDYQGDRTEEKVFQMLKMWNNDFDHEVSEDGIEKELMKALIQHGRRDLANELKQGTLSSKEELCAARENVHFLTDAVLRQLSEGLGSGWEQLATHLGLGSTQVGNLKRDYYGVAEQIFQMLIKWRNDNNDDRPVDVLNKGLRQIGRNDLVADLRAMIGGSE
ncbi:uncharacterized protein LOC117290554 [Asterias rubens]|uniref:uncharacterized protein LOC117290554 n=1 Tax=Asterias rubens TaxID=7604 RepID=UPI001454F582|nr:uncharacterized protein LOC117290554 [Asterias rubens]